MKEIAFIGAGSFGFTRCLVRDILSFPALEDSTIVLMDIDDERLKAIKKAVDRIVAAGSYPAKVIATKDRARALVRIQRKCPQFRAYRQPAGRLLC